MYGENSRRQAARVTESGGARLRNLQERQRGEGGIVITRTHVCTGPDDNASAMAMITEAAVAYDKTSPASFSLDAFEGATMTPLVFKEQLRRYDPYFLLDYIQYAHPSGNVWWKKMSAEFQVGETDTLPGS